MRKSANWLKLIGLALWFYIILRLDFGRILQVFEAMDIRWFLLAVVSLVGVSVFKAMRWSTVLNLQGVRYKLGKTVGISFVSSFFGLMIPGKMGDIIKVTYVKSSGLSTARGLVSVVLDRIYDLVVLLFLSTVGLLYFSSMFTSEVRQTGFILAALALIAVLVVSQRGRVFTLMRTLLKVALSPSSYETISHEWGTFKNDLASVAKKTVVPMLTFSVLAYLSMFCQFFAVARGLGLEPPFLYLGLSLCIATLVSLLPISVGGLGTREAVFILMLGKIAISAESAVLLSFVDLVVFAVLLPGVFTLPFWLRTRTRDSSTRRNS